MHNFRNILYASTGMEDDTEGLKQALNLARHNQAALRVVLVYPELPKTLESYRKTFEASLSSRIESAVESVRTALKLDEIGFQVRVDVESGGIPPAIHFIRHVLRDGHDLVIKGVEPREGNKGFGASDMTLLRKCPCPVWLARPITRPSSETRVAVAISPESRDEAEYDLSIRLLQLSRSLADLCSRELDIVCCSDYQFEEYLRRNSRVNIPEAAILSAVHSVQAQHHASLARMIKDSGIGGVYEVHYLRGYADRAIPNHVDAHGVDVLVMGTVARTGITGFLIGNTAENILGKLRCTLVALKPTGFVSPVKANG